MAQNVWTVFGQNGTPAITAGGLTNVTVGMQFSLSTPAALTGIWMYSPSGATILPAQVGIFQISTQLLIWANTNPTWSGAAASGWVKVSFDGQAQLLAGIQYIVAVWTPTGNSCLASTASYWSGGGIGTNGIVNGIITAPNNATSDHGQAPAFAPGSNITYPSGVQAGINFWVDVEVTTGIPAASVNPPVAGFGLASPRTWQTGDLITTPRLRADMYNTASLMAQGRPFYFGIGTPDIPVNGIKVGQLTQEANSWNVLTTQGNTFNITGGSGTQQQYPVPLPGWWLIQGSGSQVPISGGLSTSFYSWGALYNQGTAVIPTREDFGQIMSTASGTMSTLANIGGGSGELLLLNPASGDTVCLFGFNNVAAGCHSQLNMFCEWIGLPGSATINNLAYTGVIGTVVANPRPASLWPTGGGTTLSGSVSAGGTVLSMPATPGLRAGQIIGLDWQDSMLAQPVAETATVATIANGTVTVTAPLLYGHSAGAPVAVPASSAFLNEQIRDQSNFLFYPPMLRAIQGTASVQSIPNNTWTTLNLALTGSGITNTIDNFSGWAATTANSYTIEVSGCYLCIGSVFWVATAAATTWGVRLIDNTGATYQGETFKTATSTGGGTAATVRHLLRLAKGQTIAVQVFQNSGGSVNTNPSFTPVGQGGGGSNLLTAPRLIVIWRSF